MKTSKNNFFEKFKNSKIISKLKKIKNIELYIAGILFVIIIIIFATYKTNTGSKLNSDLKENNVISNANNNIESYAEITEHKLANILSNVKGAGSVKVFLSFDSSPQIVYLSENQKTTSEMNNNEIISYVFEKNGSVQSPVIVKTIYPKINGVLIVATGASDTKVKLNLINAVLALFEIKSEKIQVLTGE